MKGILFKELLLRKVVAGEKTQTRRIIKNQPDARGLRSTNVLFEDWHGKQANPRYKVGEIVFLKEPYAFYEDFPYLPAYAYDLDPLTRSLSLWRNKLFMAEKYARYFIKIKDVTAQRLQEITNEDAWCEGVCDSPEYNCIAYFQNIWIQLHGFSSWPSNPWIWKYTFERVATSEDWSKNYPYKILDPDGWDRSNWQYSWFEEKISLNEFENRVFKSTVIHKSSQ